MNLERIDQMLVPIWAFMGGMLAIIGFMSYAQTNLLTVATFRSVLIILSSLILLALAYLFLDPPEGDHSENGGSGG